MRGVKIAGMLEKLKREIECRVTFCDETILIVFV